MLGLANSRVVIVADEDKSYFDKLQELLEQNVKHLIRLHSFDVCLSQEQSYCLDNDLIISSISVLKEAVGTHDDKLKDCFRHSKLILFFDNACVKDISITRGYKVSAFFPVTANTEYLLSVFQEVVDGQKNSLTGKYNKEVLLKHLRRSEAASLILLDIDNLERFNSAYGYDFGDAILLSCASVLEDNKPTESQLYHIVGDVFGILVKGESLSLAKDFATIINIIANENPISVHDIDLSVSFTIGIAYGSGEHLLYEAQKALNYAKTHAKNKYSIYDIESDMEDVQTNNLQWMKRVKVALETNNIFPWFQPIYSLKSGKIEKFESLARLYGEEGDTFSPGLFLESAKLIGVLPNITYAIINKSFNVFKDNDASFSINVSEEDLKAEQFIGYLENRLKIYNIDPSRVVIEVLESLGSQQNNFIKERIRYLKSLGLRLAIDDFGVDSSNFSRIFEMEADLIKIDGSFIKNIHQDEKSYKIVRSIVAFAHSIGAEVVAEFVSSKEIFDVIDYLGIEYAQGYYIAPPAPELNFTPEFK